MTAQPTQTLADQMAAFDALGQLAASYPHLPQPYVTVSSIGCRVGVQLSSPAEFEVWREALGIDALSVELKEFRAEVWLEADGVFAGVQLHLAGFGVSVPAPVEAVAA